MNELRILSVLLYWCFLIFSTVLAIKCYYCDNSVSPACGKDFKAYQFSAVTCSEGDGVQSVCGKQEQPPDKNGWVGVIRSCYYPGDLPGINETVGCHNYFHDTHNFSALYCFCSTAYCNNAPETSLRTWSWAEIWTLVITLSALI